MKPQRTFDDFAAFHERNPNAVLPVPESMRELIQRRMFQVSLESDSRTAEQLRHDAYELTARRYGR